MGAVMTQLPAWPLACCRCYSFASSSLRPVLGGDFGFASLAQGRQTARWEHVLLAFSAAMVSFQKTFGHPRFRGPVAGNDSWEAPDVLQVPSERRWRLPAKVREAILQRDGFRCWYCGKPDSKTVDHWIPLCRGGTNDVVNLVCACEGCNEVKGNSAPHEFARDSKHVDLETNKK